MQSRHAAPALVTRPGPDPADVVQRKGRPELRGMSFAEQSASLAPAAPGAVQRKGGGDARGDVRAAAQAGVAGSGGELPFADRIQASFGRHDVGKVRAYSGGNAARASEAIGAEAYATGDKVAFAGAPDLHTAAHEAAHTVQQQAGVQLLGGVGQAGDGYERQADAAADAVVRGASAEGILGAPRGGGGRAGSASGDVQRKDTPKDAAANEGLTDKLFGLLGYEKKDPNEATAKDVFDASLEMFAFSGFAQMRDDVDAEVEAWANELGDPATPPVTWADIASAAIGLGVTALTAGIGGGIAQGVMNKIGAAKDLAKAGAGAEFAGSALGDGIKNAISNTAGAMAGIPSQWAAGKITAGDGSGAAMKDQCEIACKREIKRAIDDLDAKARTKAREAIRGAKLSKDDVSTVVRIIAEAVAEQKAKFPKMVKDMCMQTWLDISAKAHFGTKTYPGKPSKDGAKGSADIEAPNLGKASAGSTKVGESTGLLSTGTAGFLNIRVTGGNAGKPLSGGMEVSVDAGAAGGEEGVKRWLLDEQGDRPMKDIKMAKIIGGTGFTCNLAERWGHNEVGVNETGEIRVTTDATNQSWSTNASDRRWGVNGLEQDHVKDWMAQRALGKAAVAPEDRTEANSNKGVRSFLDAFLKMSIKQAGHKLG